MGVCVCAYPCRSHVRPCGRTGLHPGRAGGEAPARGQEALSPRALRRVLGELQAVVQPRTSEVEGGRSAQAAEQFRALGFTKVHNITGGIDAWAQQLDSSIGTY